MGLEGGRISNSMGVPLNQWLMNQLNERSKQIKATPRDTDNIIYQANKTAWIRLVSSVDIDNSLDIRYFNNRGLDLKDKSDLAKKFILQGGTSIYNSDNNKFSYEQRGGLSGAYNVAGNNEVSEYGYRPMPGITSVKVTTQGKMGSIRSADIQIKVWDKDQLDVIDTLFFKLGYTMFLEWGHTNYYNSSDGKLEQSERFSINPFSENLTKEKIFNRISRNVIESQGNYDAMLGMVTNFNFSYNQEGGYDCTIKLMALGILASGIKINNPKPLPDIQEKIIKLLVDTLIKVKNQELLDQQNKDLQDSDYPPCVRNRGAVSAIKDSKRVSGENQAILLQVNNVYYYFYKNKKYQTTGFSLTGNYDCQGNEIIIDGVNENLRNKTYEQIIKSNTKSLGYTYAPYSTNEQLLLLTENGLTDRNRGSQYLDQAYSFEIGIGSSDYLAFNKFKQLVPIDNIKNYDVEAILNFPTFIVSENAQVAIPLAGQTTQGFQTFSPDNTPKVAVQKKVADLLTLSRPVSTLFGNPIRYTRSSGENLSINQNIDLGSISLGTNLSRKNDLYYQSFVNYNNVAKKGTITETHDFFILFSYSANAISSDDKKSTSPEINFPADLPKMIKPDSDQDKINKLIIETLKNETSPWKLVRAQNSIINPGSIYSESDIRIPKIYITLEKEISITLPQVTKIKIGNDPTNNNKPVFEDKIVENQFKIHLQIDTNDLGIIGGLQIKKDLGFTIVDALSIPKEQGDQIAATSEPENPLNVSDIQKSEALKYQSTFEVIIRTIQLYSLNNAIDVGGIETEYPRVSKLDLTKAPHYENFTKGLFSVGIFSNMLGDLINGLKLENKEIEDYDRDIDTGAMKEIDMIKLRSRFGFNFSLMGNKVSAKELLAAKTLVDYSELMTTYTVPYKVNIGIFEGTQVNHPVYVKLGFAIMIINHICNIYDVKKDAKNTTPLVYFDFNPNTNICLSNAKQLSTNPYDVLIPFEGTNEDFKSIIDPSVVEGDYIKAVSDSEGTAAPTLIYKPEDPELGDRLSSELPKFKIINSSDTSAHRGRTMNILVSTDYLLRTVAGYTKQDQSNDIYAKEFIEQILFDVNKYLGDFNMFRLAYDDSGNTMYIVDDQMTPNIENKYIDETNRTEFPLFGLGSLARSLEIRTEVSSKLSNMIAISANSSKENLSSLSKTSDSFGFYNLGYNDRYIPARGELTGNVVKVSNATINSAIQFNKAVETYYSDTMFSDTSVSHATNYFIERMSKIKGEEKGTRSSAVIPVSLNFSTDGISGLGMGQAFTISQQFLPQTYDINRRDPYGEKDKVNTIGFVVVGLDQTIEGNQWISNVRANMMFLKKRQDFEQAKLRREIAPSSQGFKSTQASSTSNYSNTNFVGKNNEAKLAAEAYLGSTLTESAWSELVSATFAEASADQTERAYVMAVILNRVRTNYGNYGKTVYGQLRGKNQFESVTGKNTNNFRSGINTLSEISIYGAAERLLSSVPKTYLYFTSANRSLFYDPNGNKIKGRDSSNFDNAVKNYKLIGGSYFG